MMNMQQKVHACPSSTVSSNLTSSVSVSFAVSITVVIQRCFCHSGLNTLGSSQHRVFSFCIQMTLCITCSFEICLWGVYICSCMRTPFCLLCALFGICLWFIYAGNSIERNSLSGGEPVYRLHAYFIAIWSNRFKTHYQRCMLLQCFGSSDEASGEVG